MLIREREQTQTNRHPLIIYFWWKLNWIENIFVLICHLRYYIKQTKFITNIRTLYDDCVSVLDSWNKVILKYQKWGQWLWLNNKMRNVENMTDLWLWRLFASRKKGDMRFDMSSLCFEWTYDVYDGTFPIN